MSNRQRGRKVAQRRAHQARIDRHRDYSNCRG